MPTRREIAEAFSSHRFEDALPFVASDAEWSLVGADVLHGGPAIAEACRATASGLVDTDTAFSRFDVIDGDDTVVVDSVATYTGPDGAVTVASCDLYSFRDDLVVAVRSYTVELDGPFEGA